MGRVLLVGRLAIRDLRRRRAEAALLLLAITAATTTLTLGLVLREVATDPYDHTRAATNGPDVIATVVPTPGDAAAERATLEELTAEPGVIGHSGPFPVIPATLRTPGRTSDVQAIGRDVAPAVVDQPKVTRGSWVRDGGAVVEAAFADQLGLGVGDRVTLDDQSFVVAGVAVTAAAPPYPESTCFVAPGCISGASRDDLAERPPPAGVLRNPGLIWLTDADLRSLATDVVPMSFVMHLVLTDPDRAQAFVDARAAATPTAPRLETWQDVLAEATAVAEDARILLVTGAWLLGLLATATLSVLVGGRMADQTRRVGLLKAVGATPVLVASVLLAEHVIVAVAAAAAGLTVGSVIAPLFTAPSAGLVGSVGTPPITVATAALVTAVALVVATVATFVPAVRAARTSTVHALADRTRPPHRTAWAVASSTRLPAPLLLAVRIAARRPRRVVLSAASIAITVSGIYGALVVNAELSADELAAGADAARTALLGQVLYVVMAMVLALAATNAVFVTWATVLDNRRSSAVTRALGATGREVSVALAVAQVLPALVGAVVGLFPGGIALVAAINVVTGGDTGAATSPPVWQLLAVLMATVLAVSALTAIPARLGNHRPVAHALRAELT